MKVAYLCLQATKEGQASHAHVHEIIRGLDRRGIDVTLYEPQYGPGGAPGVAGRLREFRRVQRALIADLDRYDVVYIRHHWATVLAARAAQRGGVPVVQEVNGPYEDFYVVWSGARRLSPLLDRASRMQLGAADGVVVVTPGLADWTRAETGRTGGIAVIPNGADPERFRPDAPATIEIEQPYVTFVGRLAGWQGVDTLLEAVRQPAWPDAVRLVVAGDGEAAARVREEADRGDTVRYLGRIGYDDVPGVLAGSIGSLIPKNDIAGHSVTGLYPIKLFETLSSGVPAVVTDFPGMADLVREVEGGIVVPRRDPGALAASVRRLAEDPDLVRRLGSNGRNAILAEHSWDRRAEATAALLDGLVSR